MMLKLTRLTSITPTKITKRLSLGADGALVKSTQPQSSRGRADVLDLDGMNAMAELLLSLKPSQALIYGLPNAPGEQFEVFSRKTLPEDHAPHQIARTDDCFTWATGPGVLMLDYDPQPGQAPLERDALLALLEGAIPALRGVSKIWWPSASSCIWNGDSELAGIKGQRLYVPVSHANDIPRAGQNIAERLWLAGHGRFDLSKSGALLPRTVIDTSVWQTNRLDFAAGADCVAPLEQRRGAPLVMPGDALLDTVNRLPDLTPEEQAHLVALQAAAKLAMSPQADEVRKLFSLELANKLATDPENFTKAKVVAEHAVLHGRLMGDFPLILDDGTALTVGDVLDNREKYHMRRTRDPLEPDYNGGHVVGRLHLIGGRPNLYSFAHGGRTYKLIRAPRRLEVVGGRTSDLIDRTLESLRHAPDLFDLGDVVATVVDGKAVCMTENTFAYYMGHENQFWCRKKLPSGAEYDADLDPPFKVVKTLMDMRTARKFRPLDAVITAPTLRPDGSILDRPGYDAKTRLFFDQTGRTVPSIPHSPSAQQTKNALERLMEPFAQFPFVGPLDRSVMLASLLTAAIRPSVPTAPAFAFDAPNVGSGKTLLARCVGILACGAEPQLWAHIQESRDSEAEVRKRLLTSLKDGGGALVWDNVTGIFNSPSIAALLTAPVYTDRLLGQTRDVTIPNRALFLATGNNITLAGDMPRRFLTCRIDPQTEHAFTRRFDLNPAWHCKTHRTQMIADALTVIRAWFSSSEREIGFRAEGATASFEQWDELVRQPVAWLAHLHSGEWQDPMDSIRAATSIDPEAEAHGELLDALHHAFGAGSFTAGDVAKRCTGFAAHDDELSLANALEGIVGRRDAGVKTIGRVLMNRKGRIVGGRRLVLAGRSNVIRWCVKSV